VLRSGHAARILVERVEKPTDNGSASLLCCRVADADSPETISTHGCEVLDSPETFKARAVWQNLESALAARDAPRSEINSRQRCATPRR
jgi:hypothetical protein